MACLHFAPAARRIAAWRAGILRWRWRSNAQNMPRAGIKSKRKKHCTGIESGEHRETAVGNRRNVIEMAKKKTAVSRWQSTSGSMAAERSVA